MLGDTLSRTFFIRLKGSEKSGTGFVIYVDDREYLVTAAHIVDGLKAAIDVSWKDEWRTFGAKLVGSASPQADIAVLALERSISQPTPLILESDVAVSEQFFFLGFPYGLRTTAAVNRGFPIPFVKTGIVSGYLTTLQGRNIGMYVDAINNHGFSGGPVVSGGSPPRIVGVVSGYRFAASEVLGPNESTVVDPSGTKVGLHVNENTGLMVAYFINFALDMIKANPIGPKVGGR